MGVWEPLLPSGPARAPVWPWMYLFHIAGQAGQSLDYDRWFPSECHGYVGQTLCSFHDPVAGQSTKGYHSAFSTWGLP